MQHDWAILELWLVVELDFATALHGLSRDTATNHSDLYIRRGPSSSACSLMVTPGTSMNSNPAHEDTQVCGLRFRRSLGSRVRGRPPAIPRLQARQSGSHPKQPA